MDSIASDPLRVVGGPTLVEASAVMLGKRGPQGVVALDALLHNLVIEIVPMLGTQHGSRVTHMPATAKGWVRPAF